MSERRRKACPLGSLAYGAQHTKEVCWWVGGWNRAEVKQASQPGPHPGNTASRGQAFLELALLFSLTWIFPIDHPRSSWHVTLFHFWVLALAAPFCLEGCIHSCLPFNMVLLCLGGGFPGSASGKEPTCQCGRCKRCWFDPWVWKIPWRRTWEPSQVFLSGESHGQRSQVGCSL